MQIFVIGMHRSGTSITARLLNLMGAYFGSEGISTGANEENPKGFWERRDVRALNDMIIHSTQAEWHQVNGFSLDKIPEATLADFEKRASRLILELDAHRPWFLKEPRFCLTFSLWRKHLEVPVCIHVYRSPIQIAQSLRTRNGFPLQFGIALWEKYTLEALKVTKGHTNLLVLHSEILTHPLQAIAKLHQQLTDLGCQGLRIPHEKEILAFINPELHRERGSADLEAGFINKQQAILVEAFESEQILALADKTDINLSAGAREILEFHERDLALNEECQHLKGGLVTLQASEATLQQEREQLKTSVQSLEGSLHAKETSEAALQQEREQLKTSVQSLEGSLRAKETNEAALQQEREQLKTSIKILQDSVEFRNSVYINLKEEYEQIQNDFLSLKDSLKTKEINENSALQESNQLRATNQRLTESLNISEQQLLALRQQYKLNEEKFEKINPQLLSAQQDIENHKYTISKRNEELHRVNQANHQLSRWIEQLQNNMEATLTSWRWKIGNSLVRLAEMVLLRPKAPLAVDHMKVIFQSFSNQKKK